MDRRKILRLVSKNSSNRLQRIRSSLFIERYETFSTNKVLSDMIQETFSQQNQHRTWISVSLPQIDIDIFFANQCKQQFFDGKKTSAVLLNSNFQICQLTQSAQIQYGLRKNMQFSLDLDVTHLYPNLLVLQIPLDLKLPSTHNHIYQIFQHLQSYDNQAEVDYFQATISLDITNCLAELPQNIEDSKIKQLCNKIFDHINLSFQTICNIGIGPNLLLSKLAATESMKFQSTQFQLFDGFKKHLHLDLSIPTLCGFISPALTKHLNKINIFQISQIWENIKYIYSIFGEIITKSLIQIYCGVSRCYHAQSNDVITLIASRSLDFTKYVNIAALNQKCDDISSQLISDMKNQGKFARQAKLIITRADHSQAVQIRDQLITNSYLKYETNFLNECKQMVQNIFIDILNSPLRSISIQLFDLQIQFNHLEDRSQKSVFTQIWSAINSPSINQLKTIKFNKFSYETLEDTKKEINQPQSLKQNINFSEKIPDSLQNIEKNNKIELSNMIYNHNLENQNKELSRIDDIKIQLLSINSKQQEKESCNDLIYNKSDFSNESLLSQKQKYLLEKFSCPLCGKQIDCKSNYSLLNSHIDKCLSKQVDECSYTKDTKTSSSVPKDNLIPMNHHARQPLIQGSNETFLLKQSKRGRPFGSKNKLQIESVKTINCSNNTGNTTPGNTLYSFGFKK